MSPPRRPVLPPDRAIFWRRRALVLLIVLALGAPAVWLLTRKSDDQVAAPPQSSQAQATQSQSMQSQSMQSQSMQAQSIQGQSIQGQSSASSDPVTTFAGTGRPLELPARCDPAVLALALAGPETLAVTTPTTLTVDLANPDGPCTLDLASHPIDVTITSGTDAIWSTTHCPSGLPTGAMQLSSTPVQFSLPWTVRRSAPGCSLSEAALKPGTYVATVAVKDGRSDRMVMRITG